MQNLIPQDIDTTGSKAWFNEDNMLCIELDKRVSFAAMQQVVEYLYTDKINWDKNTDKQLIKSTKEAAQYLKLKRLEQICETFLDTKNVGIGESEWWKNLKWAYENLRKEPFDMTDLTLICRSEGKEAHVRCHALILTAACKYFSSILLGDVDNPEKKSMAIVVEDCSEKQMECILKYIYTREFQVELNDVIGVWILANKFLLEDLQVECESVIMKNITKENVKDIKTIAEMVKSKRVKELCEDVENSPSS